MPTNQKKVKLILFSAILIVLFLLTISIIQVVCIQNLSKQSKMQQTQIKELNNKLDYYTHQEEDNKQGDTIITIVPGDAT